MILFGMKLYSQAPIGGLRSIDFLSNRDTLILTRTYGDFWGGPFFGVNFNYNFGNFILPRNYNPSKPSSFYDSLISYPSALGDMGYHAGIKLEFNPAGSFFGGGLDITLVDHRSANSSTNPEKDSLQTRFVSNIVLDYITISPYGRYNFSFWGKDWYASAGLDFETKYSSILTYKKTFDFSQIIDHERVIAESPLSFRFGFNFGIGLDVFSGDINKRIRMRINPYLNIHVGSNVFNEFKSSLNMVYVRGGVSIKMGPDRIKIDTLKFDSALVMPPIELALGRQKDIQFPGFTGDVFWPDSLKKPDKVRELSESPPDLADNSPGASLNANKQPVPERKKFVIKPNQTVTKPYTSYNTTTLTRDMQDLLSDIADFLKENPSYTIIIDAHTSGEGKDENDRLDKSKKRGNAAIKFLVDKGVERGRIFMNPRAATMLKFPPIDKRNNRLDILINK